jgi:hypothetical protein
MSPRAPARARETEATVVNLFDDFERTDTSFQKETEGNFAFLNRAADPVWFSVRDELERWFAAYPHKDASDLRGRFRSSRHDQHWAAWWELYLHRVFDALGFDIDVHPTVARTTGRPDFALQRQDTIYVEAMTVFSGIVDEARSPDREAWLIDALNEVRTTDFFGFPTFERVGMERPSKAQVVRPVEKWLATLDADEVERVKLAGGGLPAQSFSIRDWRVHIVAFPRRGRGRHAKPVRRFIGIGPISAGFVDDRYRIGRALDAKKKAGQTRVDGPLLLAVLGMSPVLDQEDVGQALFGSEAFDLTTNRLVRQPDGLWLTRRGVSVGISGVLVGSAIQPWSVAQKWPRLWLNPWAEKPLREPFPFPSARVEEDEITFQDEKQPPHEALGLPLNWPGQPQA